MNNGLITPNWPAPSHIKAYSTTRTGGVSPTPYDSLNLGLHVEDSPNNVLENRTRLKQFANLPNTPLWLQQTHSTHVIDAASWTEDCEADGIFTHQKNTVCIVMTADCLPVLITNAQGTQVAAIHAGWRGLLNGILESAIKHFQSPFSDLHIWLGPAIGPTQFEVGTDVFEAFVAQDAIAKLAFQQHGERFLANIYELARQRLQRLGITSISGGQFCTASDAEHFFSYRRDHQTGRMATLIWIDSDKV